MKELTTKEHLLHFMQSSSMRLSKYDLRFVQNLLEIINQNEALTTNQVNLFEHLLSKYRKQLDKQFLTESHIKSLPWTTKIKESDPYYTEAYISIIDDKIYLRAPFNKSFISDFRSIINNTFRWDKINKRYEAEYSTTALKIVVYATAKFYNVINYCPITSDLLNTLLQYDNVKFWTPTLVKVNDSFIIAASNDYLQHAIRDIELNNDAHTLSLLAEYGVCIDSDIIKQDPKLQFASEFKVNIDYLDVDNLITWLKELGCDHAYIEHLGFDVSYRKILKNKLKEAGIAVTDTEKKKIKQETKYKFSISIEFHSFLQGHYNPEIRKIIKMTNSMPIQIK